MLRPARIRAMVTGAQLGVGLADLAAASARALGEQRGTRQGREGEEKEWAVQSRHSVD